MLIVSKTPWRMLVWLLLTQLMVAFVGRSIGPLAPLIEDSFHLSKAQVGLLPAALFIGQSFISVLAGWYADVLGTRKMMLILSIVLSLGYLAASLTPWFYVSLFFIFLGGLGYGAMHPTSNRGIIYWFPPNVAGTAMGIKQMGVTGGSALGAIVLIPVAISLGWRGAMGISILLLSVIGAIAYAFYRDPPMDEESSIQGTKRPNFKKTFKHLLHNKPLLMVSVAAMGLTGAQLSLSTYMVIFASQSLKYSLVVAGSFLALYEIGGSIGRIAWGMVSDRCFGGERTPVLMIIALITSLNSMILAFMRATTGMWYFVLIIFIMGFCVAGFNGIWMNYASESVSRSFSGVASGLSLGIGSWGVVLGPPLFGWIIDWSGSFSFAWLFIAGEMLAVIGCLWWAEQKRKQNGKQRYEIPQNIS
jgi:MFS transporter, ACS family, hexuronate transporter